MPALHAPTASRAVPDLDAKLADQGSDRRQVFLILRDDFNVCDGPVTVRTRSSNWGVVVFLDVPRHGPMDMPTMGQARLATWAPRGGPWRALGERRGLAIPRPAGRLKLFAQPLILAAEPIALALEQRNAITEQVVLLAKSFSRAGRRGRFARVVGRHTNLMSHLDAQYKCHRRTISCQTR